MRLSSSRRQRSFTHLEQLERRQLLAGAVTGVVNGILPPEATYSQPGKFLYKSGGFLTKAAKGDAATIARNYLAANAAAFGLSAADVNSSIVTDRYTDADSGTTHVYLRQTYNGLDIANTDFNISVMRDGRILSAGGSFVPGVGAMKAQPIAPSLTATAALKQAASNLGLTLTQQPVQTSAARGTGQVQTFSAPQISSESIPAQLHYVASSTGVQLAWDFVVYLPGGTHHYETNVSAKNGAMLFTNDFVDYFADPNHVGTKALDPKATYPIVWPDGHVGSTSSAPLPPPTYSAGYNVYARPNQSPSTGPRTLENNPWDLASSPHGWQDTDGDDGGESNVSAGNNVDSHEDRDANNTGGIQASGGALAGDGSGSLTFNFPIDFTQEPTTPNNQLAAITNLYYWNNVIHDIHYKYGFTEAARNFQQNNYGLGGVGNDRVQADAQDGSGTNNANFDTPADGGSGRMQMYLFTAPTPDRDGDLDAQVMIHEYGHGVSNRLSGNGSGLAALQSGGMGEGWGDWWGLMILQTDGSVAAQNVAYPVGTYVLNQPLNGPGIRRKPYSYDMSIDPLTLGAFGTSGTTSYGVTRSTEVHDAGELWATVLWDMNWNLVRKYGFNPNIPQGYGPGDNPAGQGNLLTLRLIMDALKLQPISPSFLQARDAILAADNALNGGADAKEIWKAFARRGWGVNATTASANSSSVVENFEVPPALFDPFVATSTPTGIIASPTVSTATFTFDEAMNPASFDVASDVVSFTGPSGTNLKPQISGFTWTNSNKTLNITFTVQSTDGPYAMKIGPNILAADNGAAMDQDGDGIVGEASDDTYTTSFTMDHNPGPDAGGYEASAATFQNIDLVAGQSGVTSVVNATDDGSGTLVLPAGNTFTLYGVTYTSASLISVSANGYIAFGGTANAANPNTDMTSSPAPATVAPAWDDWRTDTNGTGSGDSAVLWKLNGNDLIVEWSEVPQFDVGVNPATFQAILKLNTGSRNGDIYFNYPDLFVGNATYNDGASQSTGIKATGTQPNNLSSMRLLISQNRSDGGIFVATGKAIRLSCTSAAGTVFADNNGNGVQDGGEAAVPNAGIYSDANGNGVYDAGENIAFADGSGNYKLTSLFDGTNTLRVNYNTYINTQLNPSISLLMGEAGTGKNVGVFNTTITGTGGTDTYLVRQNAAQDRVEILVGGNPTYSILKAVVPTLRFDALGGADVLTIDFVNGDPLSSFTSRLRFTGTNNDTLSATGNGTLNVDPAQETDTPTLELFVSNGATMQLTNGMHLSGIILNNGTLDLAAGASNPLVTSGLGVVGTGTLDLHDNDMVVFYGGPGVSPLSFIAGLIRTARNGGAWNGDGITSTEAANRPAHDTTLGAIEAADYKTVYGANSSFDGESLAGKDAVLVKYTYYGDTDFNGVVNGSDYARLDTTFNQETGTQTDIGGWFNGDFDYNDKADGADYALIDAAFNSQLGAL